MAATDGQNAVSIEALLDGRLPPERLCPVDYLPRRRRNSLCVAVIAIGLLNLVAYTVVYAAVGGDATNGGRSLVRGADGQARVQYTIRGHFLRDSSGIERAVSQPLWIYSYIHSITIPLTSGLMIICMLVLARPHILATTRGSEIHGRTFIAAFVAVIALLTITLVAVFAYDFVRQLQPPMGA